MSRHLTRTGIKRSSTRRGFSLLEVMLSLTLAVVLLSAIYAAMEHSWRLTATGREEMARSQVARAVLRKIVLDVRAVMFVPTPLTDAEVEASSTTSTASTGTGTGSTGTGTGSTTGTDGTTTDTSATETTMEEPSSRSLGIRGNSTQMQLHISRARRDLNFSTNVDGTNMETRTSDLRAVTYTLAGTSGTGTTGTGLIRTEGDRLIVQAVEEDGGTAAQASQSQALAPEITSLLFRYFDGSTWCETWDSEATGYLPKAIEVTIGFAPPKSQGGPLTNVAVSSSADQFRTVILVPLADPMPPETEL